MKHAKRFLALAVAAAALLVPVTSASAVINPGYEEWAGCPSKSVDPDITACAVITVRSGSIKLNKKTTPIVDPIRIVQAVRTDGKVVNGTFDGGRQIVPGGIVGITGLEYLWWLFPFSALQLYAEAELAGTPGNPLDEPVSMPLKVKLESTLLNNTCYIGSNSNPIALKLITSTTNPPPPNTPITGQFGSFAPDPVLTDVYRFVDFKLVDNAFSVPGATGCDLFGFGLINGLVNTQVGLPAPAGVNAAIQDDVTIDLASIFAVYPGGIN